MQLPVQQRSAALPVHEPGPEESIKTSISKRKTSISVYVLNVDIEESSMWNHPDIEVETSISTFLQYRGTSISKYTTAAMTISIPIASISKLHIVPDIDVINQNVDIDVS
jgi:hypothetical protein